MEYKGYTISIELDDNAFNPFTDGDCNPLVFVLNDGRLSYYENGEEYTSTYYAPGLTRGEARQHWQEFTEFKSVKTFMREETPYTNYPLEEVLNHYIDEQFHYNCTESEKLELLNKVFTAKGYPCKLSSSQGYSQGDYAEVLVVLTPEWFELTGCNPDDDHEPTLQSTIDLYGYWAWGDVYGYVITKPNECEHCHHDEPEEVDPCWGFYGDDHEKSGLLDQARSFIDEELKR